MGIETSQFEIPTRAAAALVVLVGLSFLYGVVVMGTITAPAILWLGIVGVAANLFVIYLLYRFVVAVETIAEKH